MKYNHIYNLILLKYVILFGVAFSSCMDEDFSLCDPVLSVVFTDRYGNQEEGHGLTHSQLHEARVFVYDQGGRLVSSVGLKDCLLVTEYALDVALPPGTYDFIAWGSEDFSRYTFDKTHDFGLALISLDIAEDKTILYEVPSLCYGKSQSFEIDIGEQLIEIPLTQYSNEINYSIRGLDGVVSNLALTVEDDNGSYGFDNKILPVDRFRYLSGNMNFTEGCFSSTLSVLRLGKGQTPILNLTDNNTGIILYPSYPGQETNLISLIENAHGDNAIDFDAKHSFQLSLIFDSEMRADVYIDQWKVKDNDYEL